MTSLLSLCHPGLRRNPAGAQRRLSLCATGPQWRLAATACASAFGHFTRKTRKAPGARKQAGVLMGSMRLEVSKMCNSPLLMRCAGNSPFRVVSWSPALGQIRTRSSLSGAVITIRSVKHGRK
ncbi:hypothetical protein PHLGIDRAFT_446004 [Phlebiopsis gigantea 11061_1 CR5-6]|uniref:Uncharacterized protein n=1 Tax=Phlebiopsis gigantea (strain 11061_1 CR5-6) TaxID=745531 RepID=A0A0C3S7K5_PHLG1|nr:hypothetical protein PHLGIDRAFT_446004 [Phlebiopsis gigantea 11061_1 CR5-6]